MPQLHFWDMDHTLIANDCDVSWKTYMVQCGLAPEDALAEADRFFDLYVQAKLPIAEFMAFQLAEFVGREPAEMRRLAKGHFHDLVEDRIYSRAVETIARLRRAGHRQCLLTATNRIIAEPVAAELGIDEIVATELDLVDGVYTGAVAGTYCGGEGKVECLRAFLADTRWRLADVAYYGDSTSDIPVLEAVGHPVVVNPSPPLRELAAERRWPVLDWALPGHLTSI